MSHVKVSIDATACKACALCMKFCPKAILQLDKNVVNPKGYHPASCTHQKACIACGFCAIICPDSAITVEAKTT